MFAKPRFSRLTALVASLLMGFGGYAHAENACPYELKDIPAAMMAENGSVTLSHGVNLSHWWENQQDRAPDEDDLADIRAWGFDFVRLPISPRWIEETDADKRKEHMQKLRCDLITLLHAGLTVVVDIHAPSSYENEIEAMPLDQARARLEGDWRTLHEILGDLPSGHIAIGLYNEPHLDTDDWWTIQAALIKNLRPLYPHNTFIATESPASGLWNFKNLTPHPDRNVIYDFHYYEPMIFTHHGAEWLPNYDPVQAATRLPYPVDKNYRYDMEDEHTRKYVEEEWGAAYVNRLLDQAVAWKNKYHVRVACLEFGVYRPHTDSESRQHWLGDVHNELDKNNIPWALWEYNGPFGLTGSGRRFDEDMAQALGLRHTPTP